MNLDALLAELVARKGSDLFITVGTPPTLKINGHLFSLGSEALDKQSALNLVRRRSALSISSATSAPRRATTPSTARHWDAFG